MAIAPTPHQVPAVDPCDALLLNDTMLSRFAMEVARDIYSFPIICAQFGITEELFNERICNTTQFMRYFAEHRAIWNSPLSTTQRIAAKAGMIVEEFLRDLNRLMADPNQSMASKVDAFKHLTKISGVDNVNPPVGRDQVGGGGGLNHATVVINLNHGRQVVIEPKNVTDVDVLPDQVNPPVINMPGAEAQERAAIALRQAMGLPPPIPAPAESRFGASRTQTSTIVGQPEKSNT